MRVENAYFYHYSESRNVTKVAEILGIKQPTVSFHLKKLEASLGVKLYERKREKIVLTAAGQTLNYYATEILGLMSETKRIMKDYQSFHKGELLIGASNVPANYLLPKVLTPFVKEFPQVHVDLHIETAPKVIELIKQKEIDLGIISEQGFQHEQLNVKRLVKDDLVFVMPNQDENSNRKEVNEAELQNEPLILHKRGSTREMIDKWAEENYYSLNIKMELTNIEAIRRMVIMGTGCSILSKKAIENEIAREELVCFDIPDMKKNRCLSLIYRKDRPITPLLQNFITNLYTYMND